MTPHLSGYEPVRAVRGCTFYCHAREDLEYPNDSREAMEQRLQRGDAAERREFLDYYEWCLQELEQCGRDLEVALAKLDGRMDEPFTQLTSEHCAVSTIKRFDDSSTHVREKWVEFKRLLNRVTEGMVPEKGKDWISLAVQALGSYAIWCPVQFSRAGFNIDSLLKQLEKFAMDGTPRPNMTASVTNSSGNFSASVSASFNASGLPDPGE